MHPKVDHLAFVVKDLERSVKFYQGVFNGEVGRSRGFNEKDEKAGRPVHTLVKVGDYGFDLFVEDPKDPPKPSARFLHFAFSIRPDKIDEVLERLKRLSIPYDGPKVHGGSTSISIYFCDPDGYQLEFSAKFPDAETDLFVGEVLAVHVRKGATEGELYREDAAPLIYMGSKYDKNGNSLGKHYARFSGVRCADHDSPLLKKYITYR